MIGRSGVLVNHESCRRNAGVLSGRFARAAEILSLLYVCNIIFDIDGSYFLRASPSSWPVCLYLSLLGRRSGFQILTNI